MRRIVALLISALVPAALFTSAAQANPADAFRPLASFNVPGAVAEIADVTPDGKTVIYTNAGDGNIGFVDISNPAAPTFLGDLAVDGEPTSVGISPDGAWAFVAVIVISPSAGEAPPVIVPGKLYVIDIATRTVAGTINVGTQPDSVKVGTVDGEVVVVVAIENQPIVVVDGLVTDDEEPGLPGDISAPGLVQVVTINESDIAASTVADVEIPASAMTAAGLGFPDDPQPEFVDIFGTTAAVSLQENNGIAIIDLEGPSLVRVFSTGVATNRPADLTDNDTIDFSEMFPADVAGEPYAGQRMPDAVAFSADGTVIYSADEGEFNYAGGRGWSAWSVEGDAVWDDEGFLEQEAVALSYYPDGRSDAKGVEMEGLTVDTFGDNTFAFVLSERGSFMAVYNVNDPESPEFVQLLPTGISPEGVVAVPGRDLVITADEVSGTLTIFEGVEGAYFAPLTQPILRGAGITDPWCAVSGMTYSNGALLAIPDNAAPTEIYKIALGGSVAPVTKLATVTRSGADYRYDGEGIVVDASIVAPSNPGWWIASEGNAAFGTEGYTGNLLVQIDATGAVLKEVVLPADIDSPAGGRIRSNGYEGLALSTDGRYIVAAIQRQYAGESAAYTRIARLDLTTLQKASGLTYTGSWEFFLYPLDAVAGGATWVALSEITTIGPSKYLVIERDNAIAGGAVTKKLYAFDLTNMRGGDTIQKVLVADVLDEFAPYEKVEGVAVTPSGDIWVALDNDCGEVESVLVNLGDVAIPALPVFTPTPQPTATPTQTATPVPSPTAPATTPTTAPRPPNTGGGGSQGSRSAGNTDTVLGAALLFAAGLLGAYELRRRRSRS